jgi:predicted RNA-binding protein with RPS1 domain
MTNAQVGDVLEGTVVRVYPNYAIMLYEDGETGLLHISELSNSYVRNFTGYVQVGNIYKTKVIEVNEARGFIKVSIKQLTGADRRKATHKKRIEISETSFAELEKRLPEWVKAENEGKNQ